MIELPIPPHHQQQDVTSASPTFESSAVEDTIALSSSAIGTSLFSVLGTPATSTSTPLPSTSPSLPSTSPSPPPASPPTPSTSPPLPSISSLPTNSPPLPSISSLPTNSSSLPSNSSLSHTPTGNSKNTHLLPLIGGLVGGLVFLVLVSILAFLICRRQGSGWTLDRARHGRITWPGPAIFRRRAVLQNLVANPIPSTINNPIPPESKRGRIERTRLELEEAQRLRDAFQLDLDSRSSSNGLDDDSPDGGLDTADIAVIRAQIQQMSMTIAALQAEVRQQAVGDSQPPAYSTTIGP